METFFHQTYIVQKKEDKKGGEKIKKNESSRFVQQQPARQPAATSQSGICFGAIAGAIIRAHVGDHVSPKVDFQKKHNLRKPPQNVKNNSRAASLYGTCSGAIAGAIVFKHTFGDLFSPEVDSKKLKKKK